MSTALQPDRTSVLVADDQPDVLVALGLLLKGAGFDTDTAASPTELLAKLSARSYDAVLMDLNYTRDTTSGREGLDCLARLRALDPEVRVVVMTAWGTLELAVEAMRRGANDFVLKPWSNDQIVETLSRRRAAYEGSLARRVQRNLLPRALPPLRTLDYAAECREAAAVGGDFYDAFELGPGRVALLLGDASGKGVPGALLMASLQALIRTLCAGDAAPAPALLREVNARFLAATGPEHYATLFFADYDDATRMLRYVNCGHLPPALLRSGGELVRLAPSAPVLGLLSEWSGEERTLRLEPGDLLAVFSDGATEARRGDEEFGEARLLEELRAGRGQPARALARRVAGAVQEFASGEPMDDLTLVVAQSRVTQ